MISPTITDVKQKKRPIVLLVLDGWGLSPSWGGNAIAVNEPKTMNYIWRNYPHAVLQAFRKVAGIGGKVGSSEIGHASIGSGRIVEQDLTEISLTIENGTFFKNPIIKSAFAGTEPNKKAVHLIGLLSDGGIHGDLGHAQALVKMAKLEGVTNLYIHVITDGIDAATQSAQSYIHKLEKELELQGVGKIVTIIGRFYAMDRDGYWERTAATYEALVYGKGRVAQTAEQAVALAYQEELTDDKIPPTIIIQSRIQNQESRIKGNAYIEGRIKEGDTVIFWNFRADRARQLVRAFLDKDVLHQFYFWRQYPLMKLLNFVTMTDYHLSFANLKIAFPSAALENTLGQLLANHSLTQLHVAESEKYAHVTYFFNGGREEPFESEDRVIVSSPRVEAYDSVPAMSAEAITKVLEKAIKAKSHDFMVANYANVDMVGHTGNLFATAQAVAVVDEMIRRVTNAVLAVDGVLMITADHGNAESVVTLKYGDRETLHTLNPVPFIYVSASNQKMKPAIEENFEVKTLLPKIMKSPHTLADVAPTILELLSIAKPSDMTGESLLGKLE